mmetsp:Transcript_38626/g.109232  ORF Transcript_38626/g.109232 Transcript_38626/m.109232 type:complete len:1962 (+) Transcript_38626:245-6130(+)
MGVASAFGAEEAAEIDPSSLDGLGVTRNCPEVAIETHDAPKPLLRSRSSVGGGGSSQAAAGKATGEIVKALVQAFEENAKALARKQLDHMTPGDNAVVEAPSPQEVAPQSGRKEESVETGDVHIKVWAVPKRALGERTRSERLSRLTPASNEAAVNGRGSSPVKDPNMAARRLSPKWKRQFSCLSPRADAPRGDTPRPPAEPEPKPVKEVQCWPPASKFVQQQSADVAGHHDIQSTAETAEAIQVDVVTSGAQELLPLRTRPASVELSRLASIDENQSCCYSEMTNPSHVLPEPCQAQQVPHRASPRGQQHGSKAAVAAKEAQARMIRRLAFEACREEVDAEDMAAGIGVKPLLQIIKAGSLAEAAAAVATVGALSRKPAVATMYMEHGMLHSLLELVARVMSEFTVPAIQEILATRATVTPGNGDMAVNRESAAGLLPMAAVLDLSFATNLPFKNAWALISLALPEQMAHCARERLQRLVCILLVKWHQQDIADAGSDKQKQVFGQGLEPELWPWFSIFSCPASACVLTCCWALSVIARTHISHSASRVGDLVCKLLEVASGLHNGSKHMGSAWVVVEHIARRRDGAEELASRVDIHLLLEAIGAAAGEPGTCLRILLLLLEVDKKLRKQVLQAGGGEVLVRIMCGSSGGGVQTYTACASALLIIAVEEDLTEDVAALKDLPEAIELGFVGQAGSEALSLRLISALAGSAAGARLARRVPSGLTAVQATIKLAAAALRVSDTTADAALMESAGHAAAVLAGVAHHSSATVVQELAASTRALLQLGKVAVASGEITVPLNALKLSSVCLSAVAAAVAHPECHEALLHAGTVQVLVAVVRGFHSRAAVQQYSGDLPATCSCKHIDSQGWGASEHATSSTVAHALEALSRLSLVSAAGRERVLEERAVPICVALLRLWSSSHCSWRPANTDLKPCTEWEPKVASIVSMLKALVSASSGCTEVEQSVFALASMVNPLAKTLRCSWPTAAEAASVLCLLSEDTSEGGGLEQLLGSHVAIAELIRLAERSIESRLFNGAQESSAFGRRARRSSSGVPPIGSTPRGAEAALHGDGMACHRAGVFGLCTLAAMSAATDAAPIGEAGAARVAALCLRWHLSSWNAPASGDIDVPNSRREPSLTPVPSASSAAATLRNLARLKDGPKLLATEGAIEPLLQAAQLGDKKLRSTAIAALSHLRHRPESLKALSALHHGAASLFVIMREEGEGTAVSARAVAMLAAVASSAPPNPEFWGEADGMNSLLAFMEHAIEYCDDQAVKDASCVALCCVEAASQQQDEAGLITWLPGLLSTLRRAHEHLRPVAPLLLQAVSTVLSCKPEAGCEVFLSHGGKGVVLKILEQYSENTKSKPGINKRQPVTVDTAIGILRAVAAVDYISPGRNASHSSDHTPSVLLSLINSNPRTPAAAGALACLALKAQRTEIGSLQRRNHGLVKTALKLLSLYHPIQLEAMCACVAIVGTLTRDSHGCSLLSSRADDTAAALSVILQALSVASDTMTSTFFDVAEEVLQRGGKTVSGSGGERRLAGPTEFSCAAGVVGLLRSLSATGDNLGCHPVDTPESMANIMLKTPNLGLPACILSVLGSICHNTDNPGALIRQPAVESLCVVLKNVCIRFHMPEAGCVTGATKFAPVLGSLLQVVWVLISRDRSAAGTFVSSSCVPHLVAILSDAVGEEGTVTRRESYDTDVCICRIMESLCSREAGATEVIESGGHHVLSRLVRANLLVPTAQSQQADHELSRELMAAAAKALAVISRWKAVILKLDSEIDGSAVLAALLGTKPHPACSSCCFSMTSTGDRRLAVPSVDGPGRQEPAQGPSDHRAAAAEQLMVHERRLSELQRWSASCPLEMTNASMNTSGWQTARDFNHRSSNYEVRQELGKSAAVETPSRHVARNHPAGHLPPSPLPTDRFICSTEACCSDVAHASSSVESVMSLYDSFYAEEVSQRISFFE